MSAPDPTTEQLKAIQAERADAERSRAEDADTDTQERQHVRRADKAEYLKEKLEEQARSEESAS